MSHSTDDQLTEAARRATDQLDNVCSCDGTAVSYMTAAAN